MNPSNVPMITVDGFSIGRKGEYFEINEGFQR